MTDCPVCGRPAVAAGDARRLSSPDVALGGLYRHEHGGRIYLHELTFKRAAFLAASGVRAGGGC